MRARLVFVWIGLVLLLAAPMTADAINDTENLRAPAATTYTTIWGLGTFEFQIQGPAAPNTFAVWTHAVGEGKAGPVFGQVTEKTTVYVPNQEGVGRKELSQLNGRLVCAWGRVRQEGQGEGMTVTLEEVYILVLQ